MSDDNIAPNWESFRAAATISTKGEPPLHCLDYNSSWPDSWKTSYSFDQLEIYGNTSKPGYTYAYVNRRDAALALIKRVAPRGGRILDVAAAQGNLSLALAELGYHVVWNDLRSELIDYVKLKQTRGNITFIPGDAFNLNFDSQFDVVLATEIIEHVAHPDHFLRQLARFVRPGGHVVITTPNGEYFRSTLPRFSDCPDPSRYEVVQFKPDADGHIFLLHSHEVKSLTGRAGLQIQELRLLNNFLTNGHIKTRRLLEILPPFVVRGFERLTRALPEPLQRRLSSHFAILLMKPHADIVSGNVALSAPALSDASATYAAKSASIA